LFFCWAEVIHDEDCCTVKHVALASTRQFSTGPQGAKISIASSDSSFGLISATS
jgi:hypothetical protein